MQTIARSMADTGPIEGRYMPHAPPIVGRYGKRPHSRMRRLQLRTAHASKRQGHGRAPAQRSRRLCQRCVWCAEPSGAARIRAAERACFADYRQRWRDYPRVGRAESHRSGKDTVEHPRNGHDDYANVVCGVLRFVAPPAFEQPNELASPIIVSGGAITPVLGGAGGIIGWGTT